MQQPAILTRSLYTWVLLAIVGCSGAPAVAPVKGTVKLDGKPVVGALVIFEPEVNEPLQSTGVTDEQGQFHLRTNDGREGAVVGSHRVVVRGASRFAVVSDKEADEVIPVLEGTTDEIPADYLRLDRTPLRQEVSADVNSVTFEIPSGTAHTEHPAAQ
ncbi:MAG: hypothetical protein AB7O26_01635 [Planctomycetaceae bacterium]